MGRPVIQDSESSLTRGLHLLEIFSVNNTELSISELARRSGIPKSTAHRLVTDLVKWGALEWGPRSGVRLGVRLLEIGHLVPAQRLREVAIPFAHSLNEVTHLTSNLAIRDGQDVLYVEKISSNSLRVPHSRPGGRLPMHATALGKAILAFSDRDFVEGVLGGELKALSPQTITNSDKLRKELATVRETKVAYDMEESQAGLFCVAAPVFAHRKVVGAISVTGATALAQAQRFAPVVATTAVGLSHVLTVHPVPRPRQSAQSA